MNECKKRNCDLCPIETIVKEIKDCHFGCVAGTLENHRGYIALVKRSKQLQAELAKQKQINKELAAYAGDFS